MDETTVEHSAANAQGSALETEIRQLRQHHKARLDQLSSLMSSIQSISEEVAGEDNALDTLEQSARGQFDYLRQSLEETVSSQGGLAARVEELTQALEQSERERAALAEQAQAASGESEELVALRAELEEKSDAMARLEARLEDLKSQQQADRQSLEEAWERANSAESKLGALEEESANRFHDVSSQQDQIDGLRRELAEKDRALEAAQSALEEAQDEQNRVSEEFEVLKASQQHAEATQDGLKTELLAVQREMESLRERYREGLSTEAAQALRQQVADTAEQVQHLEAELAQALEHGKKSVLAQQLTEAIEETERLEEENLRLKQQLGLAAPDRATPASGGPAARPPLEEPPVTRSPEDELHRIQESAQRWSHGPKRVIGQILLDAGVITAEQLEMALELQKSNPQQHLGSLLAELGFASDEAIAQARASQCGVDYIRFSEETVDPDAAQLISVRLASQHACIPISATDSEMVLAVTNPMDLLAIEDVERFTNRKVEVVVGTGPDIEQAISRYYWEPE